MNVEVLEAQYGEMEIVVYINGDEVGFGNSIITDTEGVKKDYDVQSENVLKFEAGDIISVRAVLDGNILVEDIITMIEIVVEE